MGSDRGYTRSPGKNDLETLERCPLSAPRVSAYSATRVRFARHSVSGNSATGVRLIRHLVSALRDCARPRIRKDNDRVIATIRALFSRKFFVDVDAAQITEWISLLDASTTNTRECYDAASESVFRAAYHDSASTSTICLA